MSTAYRMFRALPRPVHDAVDGVMRWRVEREVAAVLPSWDGAQTRLLIAPLNTAGQGWCWARAAEQHAEATRTISVRAQPRSGAGSLSYRADIELTPAMQLRGLRPYAELALGATHVLAESGRAVLDDVLHRTILDDLPALTDAGVRTAVVLHGSEIRDLRRHAELYPTSPFAGEWDERWQRMQQRVEATQALLPPLRDQGVPIMVSTPDLLEHVPGAHWLPIAVDTSGPASRGIEPALRRARPVVLHAPSNPRLKGTAVIDRVLGELESAGRLEYRRLEGVLHETMLAAVADADVVIDQIVLGNPGVLLAETMAAGRVAVAHLSDGVRAAMQAADPEHEAPPVIEADPKTLRDAVERLLEDREGAAELASRGPAWATRNHDGTRSARVLREVLLQR